jgi:hypothetical protein
MPAGVFVGSERERYLRVLQTVGLARPYPWSIRGFSPREVDQLRPSSDAHPWAGHPEFGVAQQRRDRPELLPAAFAAEYNTAFPFGMNDGPIWAGRGFTVAAQAGGAVRVGRMSVTVAPLLFVSENRSFALMPNGQAGNLRFADPLYPTTVDRPQRFGDHSYARLDPGQSTARVDLGRAIAIGVSTANQWWGPMTEFPYILGNNAPGFTHVFIGSPTPWNVWIGRLHARVIYGGLAQSAYTDIVDSTKRRFASGIVAVFSPRGAPGLELGAARFFHTVWPETGIETRDLLRPFETFLKANLPEDTNPILGSENQLASAFFRWVLPRSGIEVYGEFGREDHSFDTRDLIQEPDHVAAYGLGLQKAWRSAAGSIFAVRGELANLEVSSLHRHRNQYGAYIHGQFRQGHTHRGQLLGAGSVVGSGGAASLRLERYTSAGSESIGWSRLVRMERDNPNGPTTPCSSACLDVQHVLRVERTRSRGRLDVRYGLTAVFEMNRDFVRDAMNWNPELELRWRP